jgi:hypothetical protein
MRETTRQRIAFGLYHRLGPNRSLSRLREEISESADELGFKRVPSLRTLKEWSSRLHWQDRIADLETQARRMEEERRIREQREMDELHIKTARAMLRPAIQRLAELDSSEIDLSALPALVREAVRIERLARGEPTEVTKHQGGVVHGHIDLTRFTYEELRRLAESADSGALGDGEEEAK